ncbi:uncharacterized protein LOC108431287 isoform X2 [Pygocentrus nattereri]|uniref:uncharacterized protein LOC108431287 isoform X2 n=1 Tax=Pygocentrus nattereri TaxID=42514 RepID=UPI001891ECF8|nr:uncharacterized protein LOC108431287 isoform X2 [Pygocentrus nattereri]
MEMWSLIIYVIVMMTVSPMKDGHPDFWPAEIFGSPTVKVGENMQLQCIDFDQSVSSNQLHLYLLKNGAGVMMELLGERHEHNFTVKNVSVLDSGKYSCVFSLTKYPLKNLNASALKPGQKTIQVQVTDGHPDFWPAEIFGSPTVKVGENMQLQCIDFDQSVSSNQLHLYLLKNGAGVMMELLGERHEHKFTVKNVSVLDSGKYSCVFSLTKYPLKSLNASALKPGQKTIQVQVTDGHPDFWPAEIFGRPTVKVGENIQLTCIDFDQSVSSNQLHLYLLKNGAGVMMELLGERHEHKFTVKNVSVLDSGKYSCVFSLTKYPLKNLNASALKPGQKTIQVQVTEHPLNMSTNEENDGQVQLSDNSSSITDKHPQQKIQHSDYLKNLLITLLVLLLVVILSVEMYRNRAKMFTEFCHKQAQSGQDNTGYCEEQVMQAVNREESLHDTCEYSTIPELKVYTSSVDICYAESGVYSLAQTSAVYSLAEHPDVKINSKQPYMDDVYAKVQKKKKEITHVDFLMYE